MWIWSRKKGIDLELEEKKVWKCFLIKGALIPQFLQYIVADVAWGNRKITQKVNLCSFILSQHTLSRSGLVSWQKRLYIAVASKYAVQSPSHVRLLWPHGLQHTWPPCPHHLPKFAQVHVHCIGDAIQPSHPLTPSPSVLNLSQCQLVSIQRKWKLCLTLCKPMGCSLWGASIHGIFQARVLEYVAISSSRGSSPARDWTWVSCIASRHFYHLSHQGSANTIKQYKYKVFGMQNCRMLKR